MNKEALLEEMLNELGNGVRAAYNQNFESKLEESSTIWTSEYNYDEEFINEQYQEYLDNYIPSEPKDFETWKNDYFEDMAEEMAYEGEDFDPSAYTEEELNEMYDDYKTNYVDPGPLDKEKWEFSFLEFDSQSQWEVMDENFTEQIFPMIEKQCHHNRLILMGTTGRWTGTSAGGDIIKAEEKDLRNLMADYDEINVNVEDDNQLSMDFIHHDGTDSMYLYTYPEILTELSKIMGYEDETEFESDVESGYIDAQDLEPHKGLLIKIVQDIEEVKE